MLLTSNKGVDLSASKDDVCILCKHIHVKNYYYFILKIITYALGVKNFIFPGYYLKTW